MSGRLRNAVTAPDSTWSSLSSPGARSVPKPMRREQISFPNPRRMESKFRSLINFCFPLRMRRFCSGHFRANDAFTTPNLPDEGAEPGGGANAYACHELCLRTPRAKRRRSSPLTLGRKTNRVATKRNRRSKKLSSYCPEELRGTLSSRDVITRGTGFPRCDCPPSAM